MTSKVDASPNKRYTFQLQAEFLFCTRGARQFDFTTSPQNTLPRQFTGRNGV